MSLYVNDVDHKKHKHLLPIWLLVLIFAVVTGLFFIGSLPLVIVPESLMVTDEASNPNRFIGENAYKHVEYLATKIGYRFTGSYNNEVLTVEYLLKVVDDIKSTIDPSLEIETEVQQGDGAFHELWQSFSSIDVYENLQNVIVKLSVKENDNNYWILLNSHFDAVPMSPGAGDDGTMVGIMLELLRVLAKTRNLSHTVVFLFNGCEENSLQGAHSFITNYPSIDNVNLLINLDVAGPGGKELMFQTSPEHSWLMDAYFKAIKNPFATVIAEEMYQNGFIPSDTDFSQFREFVGTRLPAYDFAHIRNGYVYHSKHDDIENIDMGSLQSTGDNMLGLLKELDDRKELDASHSVQGNNYVFYDFFGTFLIFYTRKIGTAINSIVFCIILILVAYSMYRINAYEQVSYKGIIVEYFIAIVVQILGICLGFAFLVFLAWFLNAIDKPMTWFSQTWMLFGTYFLQFFLINAMCFSAYIKFRKQKYINEYFVIQLQLHAYATLIAIVMIVMTAMQIRTAFIFMITLIFYIFSTLLNMAFKLDMKNNKWLYSHMLGQIIPITFYFYMYDMFLSTLIPTIGREYTGADSNPEYMIGLVAGIFSLLILQFFAPTLSLFKYGNYCIAALQLVFCIFIIILFTPLSFPYKEATAPQRFYVWHSQLFNYDYQQKLIKSDTGFYVFPFDRHGIKFIKDEVPLIRDTSPDEYDMRHKCNTEILCGIPHYHVYYTANAPHSIWLKRKESPKFTSVPEMKLVAKEIVWNSRVRYSFQITSGTSHMSLHISPLPDVRIVKWSFTPEMKENYDFNWNERNVYFINYLRGLETDGMYNFFLEIEEPANWTIPYTFDIALAAQFIHQPSTHTDEFENFIETFPKWTTLQYFTNHYVSYQF